MIVARYWENPNEFIPERFLGDWNKDALVAFSVGRPIFFLDTTFQC